MRIYDATDLTAIKVTVVIINIQQMPPPQIALARELLESKQLSIASHMIVIVVCDGQQQLNQK
jgi:hypothetical protein